MSDEDDKGGDPPGAKPATAAAPPVAEVQRQVALREAELRLKEVEAAINKLAPKWWRHWNVTAVGALIAAVLPVTSAIEGHYEKQKQLVIEQQRQRQEVTDKWFDRLKDIDQRRRTLRFLAATSADPEMKQWAIDELPSVEAVLAKTEAEIEAAKHQYSEELAKLQVEVQRLSAEHATCPAPSAGSDGSDAVPTHHVIVSPVNSTPPKTINDAVAQANQAARALKALSDGLNIRAQVNTLKDKKSPSFDELLKQYEK